jgi:hypothetical protein
LGQIYGNLQVTKHIMSSGTKTILILIIILLIGGAIWYSISNGAGTNSTATSTTLINPANNSASSTSTADGTSVSARGSSDASLDADAADIDARIKAFSTDGAAIDDGLNDKPVSQTQ